MKRFSIWVIVIIIVLLLAGCPQKIDREIIESGEYYKVAISSALHAKYEINFNEEDTPTILLTYQIDQYTTKNATIKLDGYDEEKKIGYKLITKNDKIEWEQDIEDGNTDVPDLEYYETIQTAAIEYEYPIIFIDISEYQNSYDIRSLTENDNKFFAELYNLFNTQAMAQWLKDHNE